MAFKRLSHSSMQKRAGFSATPISSLMCRTILSSFFPSPNPHRSFPLLSLVLHPPDQVAGLQEEKSSLLAENQVLMERLNQSDSIEDLNSPAGRRHLQLQTQLEQLQEETFR